MPHFYDDIGNKVERTTLMVEEVTKVLRRHYRYYKNAGKQLRAAIDADEVSDEVAYEESIAIDASLSTVLAIAKALDITLEDA